MKKVVLAIGLSALIGFGVHQLTVTPAFAALCDYTHVTACQQACALSRPAGCYVTNDECTYAYPSSTCWCEYTCTISPHDPNATGFKTLMIVDPLLNNPT